MTHDEPHDDGNLSTSEHSKEAIAKKFADTAPETVNQDVTAKSVNNTVSEFEKFEIEKEARRGWPHSSEGKVHFG